MARLFAIGDIHGCLDPLNVLLDRIRPTQADTIVTLGDYVDRGPDSKGVIDRLLDLSHSCKLVSLMGNHEQMMLSARRDRQAAREWQTFGGLETLESYDGGLDAIPEGHWRFLIDALPYHETESHIFVHGALFADIEMTDQPRSKLLWGRFKEIEPHISRKIVICGHTPQISGRPANKAMPSASTPTPVGVAGSRASTSTPASCIRRTSTVSIARSISTICSTGASLPGPVPFRVQRADLQPASRS